MLLGNDTKLELALRAYDAQCLLFMLEKFVINNKICN